MGELKVEGIYPLAYIRHLTGATPRRVYARTASHFHQRHVDNDIEDLASLTLELDREMLGSICIGRIGRFNHTTSGNIKISVLGTEGALVINEPRPEITVVSRDSEDRGRTGRPVGGTATGCRWRTSPPRSIPTAIRSSTPRRGATSPPRWTPRSNQAAPTGRWTSASASRG